MWPYYMATGAIWVGSRIFLNITEGADNVASAGEKAAGAALLGLGAYLLYKKAVK